MNATRDVSTCPGRFVVVLSHFDLMSSTKRDAPFYLFRRRQISQWQQRVLSFPSIPTPPPLLFQLCAHFETVRLSLVVCFWLMNFVLVRKTIDQRVLGSSYRQMMRMLAGREEDRRAHPYTADNKTPLPHHVAQICIYKIVSVLYALWDRKKKSWWASTNDLQPTPPIFIPNHRIARTDSPFVLFFSFLLYST